MIRKIYLLLFFSSLGLSSYAQEFLTEGQIEAIDDIFSEWDKTDQPGLAIGIVKNEKLIFSKGYGMANLEHNISFSPNTIADLGSVAKQITDFAIVLLAQQGKLSLDDEISKHLDYVPDFGHPITIRHLVHHTSGLREIYTALYLAGRQNGDLIRQEDVVQLIKNQRELNFKPGDDFLYCNTSYALLAEIIGEVSGTSYESFLQENIFLPLGMNKTYIMDKQGELFPNCADSYARRRGEFVKVYDNCTMVGQGGIYSSLADMAKWLANYQNPKIGGAQAINQMISQGILNNGDTLDYAFGLYNERYKGTQRIFHSGSSAGYRSNLHWLPEFQLGFILLSNRSDLGGAKKAEQLIEILVGDQLDQRLMDSNGEKEESGPITPEMSMEELKSLQGQYYSPELQTVYTIVFENESLKAKHFKLGTINLSPKTAAKDFFSSRIGEVRFERNEKEEATAFRVSMDRVRDVKFEKVDF